MKDRHLQKRFHNMLSWFGYAESTAGPELAELLNDTREQGREEGVAVLAGIIGMAESIRARPQGQCCSCGYDGEGPHPNEEYDDDLWAGADGKTYCGECADQLQVDTADTPMPKRSGA